MYKERKFSTSIQFSETQFDTLSKILTTRNNKTSNSSIIREAFDYYVTNFYPQFSKRKTS